MKKAIVIGLIAAAALFLTAILILPMIIDVNRYRGTLEEKIGESVDMKVELGEMELTLLTGLAFSVDNARLYRAGEEKPLAAFDRMKVKPRILPLLKKKIEIKNLIIVKPSLELDLDRPSGETATEGAGEKGGFDPGSLSLERFTVKEGTITVISDEKKLSLHGLNMKIDDLMPGRKASLALSCGVREPETEIGIEARFGPLSESALPIDGMTLSAGGAVVEISGVIDYAESVVDLNINIPESSIEELMVPASLAGAGMPEGTDIKGYVSVQAGLKGKSDNPEINGTFAGRDLIVHTGIMTAPVRSEKISASFTQNDLNAENMKLSLGKNDFDGNLSLENFDAPDIVFDFRADGKLDLDDLISSMAPPEKPETARSGADSPGNRGEEEPLNMKARGEFKAAEAVYTNMKIQNLSAGFLLEDNIARADSLEFDFYGGRHRGKGYINLSDERPDFKYETELDNLNVNAFLSDATTYDDILFGTMTADFSVTGKGLEMKDLEKTMKGTGSFKVEQGKITSFSIMKQIQRVAALGGVNISESDYTEFKVFKGDLGIDNGFFRGRNVLIRAESYDIRADGDMDFGGKVDFAVRAVLSRALTEELGSSDTVNYFKEDERAVIPMSMKGTVFEPSFGLDGDYLKEKLKKKAEKKLKDKAKDKAKDLIKGLFD